MVIDSCLVVVCDWLSATCTVNVDVPAAVGVPLMTPPLDNVNPAGSAPVGRDHVYGDIPPEAVNVCEYWTPITPDASETVVIVNDGAMVIESCLVSDCEELSVTRTVKVDVPAAVGSPLIVPPGARDNPAGREPALIDHVYGGVPPDAARVCK